MSYSSEIMADSPRAYYRCQEASGNIQDSSGNANHAVDSIGAGSFTYSQASPITSDPTSKSILFAGKGFRINDHATLDLGNTFSLVGWIKRTALTQSDFMLDKGGTGVVGAYQMRVRDTDELLLSQATVNDIAISTSLINDTVNWYFCAVTKTGSTNRIYINAVEQTSLLGDSTCDDTTTQLKIGVDSSSESAFAAAYMTELAVFSTALSAGRILTYYQAAIEPEVTFKGTQRRGVGRVV